MKADFPNCPECSNTEPCPLHGDFSILEREARVEGALREMAAHRQHTDALNGRIHPSANAAHRHVYGRRG